MEIRESLFTKYLSAKTTEPYQLAHSLIHAAYSFGKVIEKENIVEASGPRTKSRVHFIVRKEMDRFTTLFIEIFAEGDSIAESLNVTINAITSRTIPQAIGLVTETFHQNYRDRIYDKMRKFAEHRAKEAFLGFRNLTENPPIF